MKDPFETYTDIPSLQHAVLDAFCDLAKTTVAKQGAFRVSLSGGSTPKRVYEMLSQRDLPWDAMHWFWGDERNVPHDHDDSNCRMVHEALLNHVPVPAENIHPVPVNVESPMQAATDYEATLRRIFPGALPKWDLVLLGMGDDAHTASLFPETKALQENDRWFVENWVEKFDAYRYTMTYPAISSGNEVWFIITGSNKKTALDQVLNGPSEPTLYPSQKIKPTRWFVDQSARQV